jgi:putative transposase
MSSTHLGLHYHLVFATKNHDPIITPAWGNRLHAYLGGMVRTVDGVPEAIGGVADHVHLLVGLRATHTLADVLREIKSRSSEWVHDELGIPAFAWQEGYGGFTVSASQLKKVRDYIQRQEEHHRTQTFREEYLELLKRSGVEFDESYL